MKEHDSNEIVLHDMDPAAVELLIEYGYTGQIVITPDNVQVLLPASSILQMGTVREACCRFLMKQLHPTNCLGIRSFADTHSCKELHRRSHCFALQNFQQVVGTEEFLLLPFQEVEELISNGQLNICSEEHVFTAVLNWIKHDLSERKQYVSKLMEHVRLPLVSREFLMSRVDGETLVREDGQCRELLLEAMRYHLAPERRCALSTSRTLERKPKGAEPYLFAVVSLVERNLEPFGIPLVNTCLAKRAPDDLVELAKEIQKADDFMYTNACNKLQVIAQQVRFLQQQAEQVLKETKMNSDLHHAACNFVKVPGNIYHLYKRPENGQNYFSMLSPLEWNNCPHEYLGSFRLELDHSWTSLQDINSKDAELSLINKILGNTGSKPLSAINQSIDMDI